MHRTIAALVLVLACTACSSSPADPPAPPQQKTVDLTGVDPCSLLTPDQRTLLGFDWRPHSGSSVSPFYETDVPSCVLYNSAAEMTVVAGIVNNTDIERFDDKALQLRTAMLPGKQLPTLVARPTNLAGSCSVIVGTAPGHLIDVHASDEGRKQPQEAVCDFASRTADEVMATITR